MAYKSRAVTVTTTATRLDTADETDSYGGSVIAIYNLSASTVYVGGSDVTTANGFPVEASTGKFSVDSQVTTDALYGIVATGTAEVRVFEQGVS